MPETTGLFFPSPASILTPYGDYIITFQGKNFLFFAKVNKILKLLIKTGFFSGDGG